MAKWSSRICSGNLLLVLVLLAGARGQEKNGEFKHELPDGVELVDPKSLGLTDADLSKFLGNVKVLGGGQVGDTKTQILTVGFAGDENINFNDFTIPGLTDGNNTALPEKDKEIADMAFQKFKEFFQDPNKAKQFEEGKDKLNINGAFQSQKQHEPPPKHRQPPQQNNIHIRHPPPQLRIPMIHKPYTTPRTPPHHPPPVPSHLPPHPQHRLQPPPPPPSPPVRHQHPQPAQTQNHQQHQHIFNSQIKSQPPVEFGARIPLPPNVQQRPQGPHHQQYQQHHQSQGQYQFHRQHEHQQQQQHRVQHQQQGHNFQRPPPPPPNQNVQPNPPPHFQQQQRGPPQVPHHAPQTPRIRFPQDLQQRPQQGQPQFPQSGHAPPNHPQPEVPTRGHAQQQPQPNPSPVPPSTHQQRPPLVQNFVIHPHPQQLQSQNVIQQQPPPQSREQGRIVRNQLLQFEASNQEPNYNGPSKGLTPPPPPQNFQSSSNQIPVHSPSPAHFQNQLPPTAEATATSSVYIQHGPKTQAIQPTSFHPQFQAPTRFAKDFTPMPIQTTTSRPTSFDVTPSMKLIPLSTNENAITDPTRMLQLRLYQQQKAQAQAQAQAQALAQAQASNTHQTHVAPQQPSPTPPTTTPISITTSYPETNDPNQQFSSPMQYDFPGSQQSQQQLSYEHNNNIGNQINDNTLTMQYNNAPFSLQTQQQQHQLHFLQDKPSFQQQPFQQGQSNQPTVYYTQEHRRPPRQGPPPRFQFHVSHDLGQGPRFQMNPDPKSLLNTIRRKRGYRRLSNLFNRMFRWDKN